MNQPIASDVIRRWVTDHPFTPVEVDCTTTVMLKILDGKCKMDPREKIVMKQLYHAVREQPGHHFAAEYHMLIARAEQCLTEAIKLEIYEKRLLAETMLSRPIMKTYKAKIREQGLFVTMDVVTQLDKETVS